MKRIFLLTFCFISISALCQNQSLVMISGDTISVTGLKKGPDHFFYKYNGQKSRIAATGVTSYFDGYDWIQMAGDTKSILTKEEAPQWINGQTDLNSRYIKNAGGGLLFASIGGVLLSSLGTLLANDNPDLANAFLIGGGVCFIGGIIYSGVQLRRVN